MAVQDKTQAEFLITIETDFDSATQDQILQYLHNQGIYTPPTNTAPVQLSTAPPLAPPGDITPSGKPAQISEFIDANFSVNTDSNVVIKAIIANSLNSNVTLGGGA